MGATRPRDLPIPGREKASGIHFAMEFLQTWQVNIISRKNIIIMLTSIKCNFCKLWQQFQWGDQVDAISAKDLDVVVIGGGDTGNDCIGKITIFNFTKKSYFLLFFQS